MRKVKMWYTWWNVVTYHTLTYPPHSVPTPPRIYIADPEFWTRPLQAARSAGTLRHFNNMHKHYRKGMCGHD